MIEASSNERHGIVTGFFAALERNNQRTFAGFLPSDDLIDDLSKLRLKPPHGYGTKWHRGVGPMAFANRSLNDIDRQTENRDLRTTYHDHLSLTMTDAKRLESATPLVPTDFEAFLLLLHRFTDFHLAAFGPDCEVYKKSNIIVSKLTSLRHRISRSPEFMTLRAPTITWALTVGIQEFYSESISATAFSTCDDNGEPAPRSSFNVDVADLGLLSITEACDLPAFLRHTPIRTLPVPSGPTRATPTSTGGARTPVARTQTATQPRAATRPRQEPTRAGVTHANPHHPREFQTFLANLPQAQRETVGLRKILQGCPNVNYRTVMTTLGTDSVSCLRYHIIGSCGLHECTKEHAPITIPPGGAATLCTLLQPGLAAIIAGN